MRGITVTDGGDLRISGVRIQVGVGADGVVSSSSATVHLRTDMSPYWLAEGVSAAIAAEVAQGIPSALAADDGEEINRLMVAELRASMRAFTSSAFAIDASYASVKARSPVHPQQSVWHEKGTARNKQVAETLRFIFE